MKCWDCPQDAGQMVVELCVVMPAVLMVSVVIIDMLVFAAECSRFDHLAPQAVISVAGAPSGTEFDPASVASEIAQVVDGSMERGNVSVEAQYDGRICTVQCKYSAVPWPLSAGNGKLFGLGFPVMLSHSCSLAVRPYVIGEI